MKTNRSTFFTVSNQENKNYIPIIGGRKNQAMLIGFWLLSLIVRLIWIWPLTYNDWFGDAAYNVQIAEDLAAGKKTSWVGSDSPFFVFTPLFHLLVALTISITPFSSFQAAKLVSVVSTSFVPPMLYVMIKRLTEEEDAAIVGALIGIFTPWFLAISVMTLATGLYITFALFSCITLISFENKKKIPIGLSFVGLASLARPEGAFLLLFTISWLLFMSFQHDDLDERKIVVISSILVSIFVVIFMMVIWYYRTNDAFIWIVSMLEHQSDEAQKGKLTIEELGYLLLIILATYSGFGGNPEPAKLDLYNFFRLGFATFLLLLMLFGIWVVFQKIKQQEISKIGKEGYYFILASVGSMLVFLILLDGRWIKYHVLGVILIQPLFCSVAIVELAKIIKKSAAKFNIKPIIIQRPRFSLIFILLIVSIQFLFSFTTSALVKSQMWEPRREITEWLNQNVDPESVVVIPHREYYVSAYTSTKSIDYNILFNENEKRNSSFNQEEIISVCELLNIRYLLTTSDHERQDDHYQQILDLLANVTLEKYSSSYNWRTISISLSVLQITF